MKKQNLKLIKNSDPKLLRKIDERKLKEVWKHIDNCLANSAEEAKRLEDVRKEMIRKQSQIKGLAIRHQDEDELRQLAINEKHLDNQWKECIHEETRYLQARYTIEMFQKVLQEGGDLSREEIQALNQLISNLNLSLSITL